MARLPERERLMVKLLRAKAQYFKECSDSSEEYCRFDLSERETAWHQWCLKTADSIEDRNQ